MESLCGGEQPYLNEQVLELEQATLLQVCDLQNFVNMTLTKFGTLHDSLPRDCFVYSCKLDHVT